MDYKNSIKELPIHPGDTIYVVDEGKGWTVRPDTVELVCISENEIGILRKGVALMYENLDDEWFLTEQEAQNWADQNRPDPPYPFWYDANKWMKVEKWIPGASGWFYVRDGKRQVCKAFYNDGSGKDGSSGKACGFYGSDSDDAAKMEGITAWMDSLYEISYAMNAEDYEQ